METPNKASFSIDNYYYDKVYIDMEKSKSDELYIDFNISGIFFEKEKKYELSIVFKAFDSNEKESNEFVMVRCIGIFNFKNIETYKDIPDFFYRNSIALLFPYIRAYVSLVTNQANIKPIILPTLNLSSLEEPLRKNTIIK